MYSVLAALIVSSSVLGGGAAFADQPDLSTEQPLLTSSSDCVDAASGEAAADGLGAFDFICVPTGVQVSAVSAEQLAAAATQTPSASASRSAADDGDFCSVSQEPQRTIINELQENWSFCVFWGRKDSNGNILWLDQSKFTGSLFPQWQYHYLDYNRTADAHAEFSMSYDIQVYKHQALQFPAEVSFVHRETMLGMYGGTTAGEWVHADTPLSSGGSGANGVYNLSYGNIHIEVPTEEFSQDANGSFDSHRFLCQKQEQRCFWPDGEEAPLF